MFGLDLIQILEIIAVLTAIIYVFLATKSNYWCFLFGLISSSLYLYICYALQFYFDVGINAFYVIMSIYGWYAWKPGPEQKATKSISRLKVKEIIAWTSAGLLLCLSLANLAERYTEASLPYLDSFTTTFSLLATWFVVKRKIENWLYWIIIDLVAAGMYIYKDLYLTAALFLFYAIIAIYGYQQWKKEMNHA